MPLGPEDVACRFPCACSSPIQQRCASPRDRVDVPQRQLAEVALGHSQAGVQKEYAALHRCSGAGPGGRIELPQLQLTKADPVCTLTSKQRDYPAPDSSSHDRPESGATFVHDPTLPGPERATAVQDDPNCRRDEYSLSRERVERLERQHVAVDPDHFRANKQQEYALPDPSGYARPEVNVYLLQPNQVCGDHSAISTQCTSPDQGTGTNSLLQEQLYTPKLQYAQVHPDCFRRSRPRDYTAVGSPYARHETATSSRQQVTVHRSGCAASGQLHLPNRGAKAYSPRREQVTAAERQGAHVDPGHICTRKQPDYGSMGPSAHTRPEAAASPSCEQDAVDRGYLTASLLGRRERDAPTAWAALRVAPHSAERNLADAQTAHFGGGPREHVAECLPERNFRPQGFGTVHRFGTAQGSADISKLVTWRPPLLGVRVGEAAHPGPAAALLAVGAQVIVTKSDVQGAACCWVDGTVAEHLDGSRFRVRIGDTLEVRTEQQVRARLAGKYAVSEPRQGQLAVREGLIFELQRFKMRGNGGCAWELIITQNGEVRKSKKKGSVKLRQKGRYNGTADVQGHEAACSLLVGGQYSWQCTDAQRIAFYREEPAEEDEGGDPSPAFVLRRVDEVEDRPLDEEQEQPQQGEEDGEQPQPEEEQQRQRQEEEQRQRQEEEQREREEVEQRQRREEEQREREETERQRLEEEQREREEEEQRQRQEEQREREETERQRLEEDERRMQAQRKREEELRRKLETAEREREAEKRGREDAERQAAALAESRDAAERRAAEKARGEAAALAAAREASERAQCLEERVQELAAERERQRQEQPQREAEEHAHHTAPRPAVAEEHTEPRAVWRAAVSRTQSQAAAASSHLDQMRVDLNRAHLRESAAHNALETALGRICVTVRCRPPASSEVAATVDEQGRHVLLRTESRPPEEYLADKVHGPTASQDDVCSEDDAAAVCLAVAQGESYCCIAHGHTGSGKTYTLTGTRTQPGIVRRVLGQWPRISAEVSEQTGKPPVRLQVAMFQLYGRSWLPVLHKRTIKLDQPLSDLSAEHFDAGGALRPLRPGTREAAVLGGVIGMRLAQISGNDWQRTTSNDLSAVRDKLQQATRFTFVCPKQGDKEVRMTTELPALHSAFCPREVHSAEEIDELIRWGLQNRKKESTGRNTASSRSHLVVSCANANGPGRMVFVDLAGSECHGTGSSQEQKAIAESLSALWGLVHKAAQPGGVVDTRSHLLTRALWGLLSGRGRCTVMLCVSPERQHAEETRRTLAVIRQLKVVRRSSLEEAAPAEQRRWQESRAEHARCQERVDTATLDYNTAVDERNRVEELPIALYRKKLSAYALAPGECERQWELETFREQESYREQAGRVLMKERNARGDPGRRRSGGGDGAPEAKRHRAD